MDAEVSVGKGRTIDLVATRDHERLAFEIEIGKSDAAVNVQKCLEAKIEKIFIIATSSQVKTMLKSVVPDHPHVLLMTTNEVFGNSNFNLNLRDISRLIV